MIRASEVRAIEIDRTTKDVTIYRKGSYMAEGYQLRYAPTSPIGQCINLLLRLILLAYREAQP